MSASLLHRAVMLPSLTKTICIDLPNILYGGSTFQHDIIYLKIPPETLKKISILNYNILLFLSIVTFSGYHR